MSQVDLERIQNDLDCLSQVIRRDRPYSAADVLPCVVIGVGAMVWMALLHWQLFSNSRLGMLLSLSPGLALVAHRFLLSHRGRAKRPVLWKEYKWSLVVVVVLIPSFIAWVWWRQRFDSSTESSFATILFCVGLVTTMIGVMEPNRRMYLPGGLLILAYSFLRTSLPSEQIANSGCALVALVAFGSAIYIAIAIRLDQDGLSEDKLAT